MFVYHTKGRELEPTITAKQGGKGILSNHLTLSDSCWETKGAFKKNTLPVHFPRSKSPSLPFEERMARTHAPIVGSTAHWLQPQVPGKPVKGQSSPQHGCTAPSDLGHFRKLKYPKSHSSSCYVALWCLKDGEFFERTWFCMLFPAFVFGSSTSQWAIPILWPPGGQPAKLHIGSQPHSWNRSWWSQQRMAMLRYHLPSKGYDDSLLVLLAVIPTLGLTRFSQV